MDFLRRDKGICSGCFCFYCSLNGNKWKRCNRRNYFNSIMIVHTKTMLYRSIIYCTTVPHNTEDINISNNVQF